MLSIEKTNLWKRAFSSEASDEHSTQRRWLAGSLLDMRKIVSELITEIPADLKDLTVHDITHLDALWEVADQIAGPNFKLNPAEAFLFGASVLLHDAALSFAAFEGGLDSIKKTTTWSDEVFRQYRYNEEVPSAKDVLEPPKKYFDTIAFEVLRKLHAAQAEKMATQSWVSSAGTIYLIAQPELRQAFGGMVGRVAHSHHWGIERVAQDLKDNVGTSVDLPSEWSVSERKVACLLRCADAAHIDRRRAPSILLSAKKFNPTSMNHWTYQNKLNKSSVNNGSLIFTSGEPFLKSEARAWWLCFDWARAIDNEIRGASSLLEDLNLGGFAVRRVQGVDSPRSFARYVTTKDWRPVDAEVRVSDPVHLAKTLGGVNLYGNDKLAAVRELIQNAIDAVRARRRLENRELSWGKIRLSIEKAGADVWLHVDDNGVGMSERVLSGPLVDFGKSIWNSVLLQDEFPGLESRGVQPIGKFGIGFFSVFLLGAEVTVVSRRYDQGVDQTNVLEFSELEARPILRVASKSELPLDFQTRVSVKLNDIEDLSGLNAPVSGRPGVAVTLSNYLKRMICSVDVNFDFQDFRNGEGFSHSANWHEVAGRQFLEELLCCEPEEWREFIVDCFCDRLQLLRCGDEIVGRAALNICPTRISSLRGYGRAHSHAYTTVGGVVYERASTPDFFVGVLSGGTAQAARTSATISVPDAVVADWISNQVSSLTPELMPVEDVFGCCYTAIKRGADPKKLPFCVVAGKVLTLSEFEGHVRDRDIIRMVLQISHSDKYQFSGIVDAGNGPSNWKYDDDVVFLDFGEEDLFIDDDHDVYVTEAIDIGGEYELGAGDWFDETSIEGDFIIRILKKAWGVKEVGLSISNGSAGRSGLYVPIDDEPILRIWPVK